MYDLVVTREFANHYVGEQITDRDAVDQILASHNASYCVKVSAEDNAPEPDKPAQDAPAPADDASGKSQSSFTKK